MSVEHGRVALSPSHRDPFYSRRLTGRDINISDTLVVDSRERDAAVFPNANVFEVNIPKQNAGAQLFAVHNVVVPLSGTTERVAYLRITVGTLDLETGYNSRNEWYTVAIPLANPDAAGFVTLNVNHQIPVLKWFHIPVHVSSQRLRFELLVLDPATMTLIPFPFAASATDPAENYTTWCEFVTYGS